MKIKLDENLPSDMLTSLRLLHDIDTVEEEGLSGKDDSAVWQAAQLEGRFFVTQDLDFSDLRVFSPGTHCGLLLLRLGNPSRQKLNQRLEELLRLDDVETWVGAFVVATDSKLRIRRS